MKTKLTKWRLRDRAERPKRAKETKDRSESLLITEINLFHLRSKLSSLSQRPWVNAKATSYYCEIFEAPFAVPFNMVSFSICLPLSTARQPKGRVGDRCKWWCHGRYRRSVPKPRNWRAEWGNSRLFHVSPQPQKQIETRKAQEQLQSVGASLWQSEPKCRTTMKCKWEKQNTGFVCKLLEQSWSRFAIPWSLDFKIVIPEVGPKFARDCGDIRGKAGGREFSLLVDAVRLGAQAAPL